MMVKMVLAPCSRGIRNVSHIFLCVFPHWYVGIIIPFAIGGIIPGIVTLMPWVFAICCTIKFDIWGWNPQAHTSDKENDGQDQAGNPINVGDVVMYKKDINPLTQSRDNEEAVKLEARTESGLWRVHYM